MKINKINRLLRKLIEFVWNYNEPHASRVTVFELCFLTGDFVNSKWKRLVLSGKDQHTHKVDTTLNET